MNILVTGATGQLGGVVVETLLKKIPANCISVLARSVEKTVEMQTKGVKVFPGDYDDVRSLEQAMQSVDKVLLVSASDEGDRMQQHKNVVNTAKSTGVQCIAYTSRSLRDRATLSNKLMLDHFGTEEYIKESGLKYTIFQNALYMDVIPLFVGGQFFEKGIYQAAGEGKVAFALREEMGEAIAHVLLEEDCNSTIYKFTGGKAYSFYDVADALSQLSKRDVAYHPISVDTLKEKMKSAGLPEVMVNRIANFVTDIKNGHEDEVHSGLEEKLGRKPASLAEGLKVLFNL